MTNPDTAPTWNPFDKDFAINPYPTYARLRKEDPLHRTANDLLLVSRYDDAFQVLRDPTTSMQGRRNRNAEAPEHMRVLVERTEGRGPSLLGLDPPDHTRLRGLVQRTFTPRAISRMREQTTTIVDELLDELVEIQEIDLISQYAFVIPFAVIHQMLGLPDTEMTMVREWSQALSKTLEPFLTPEEVDEAISGGVYMDEYLGEAIAHKRKHPKDDLLTALIEAEEEEDRLSEDELRSMTGLLFIAGHETTVNLIGNGTHALLNNPDQLQIIREDESVDGTMVDELLRYDSPVQNSGRTLTQDTIIGGVEIAAGETILTSLGSANHDEIFWGPTASELDVRRKDASRHLSFGNGIHHCLGAALARMEGEIAVANLVRRFPDLDFNGEPTYNGRVILRGRETFPVTLGSPV
ncbi:MAG: cytochrome P450 [Actinomycetota bacterium]|nr:cytochrome P450 [Actinomycetota bacterium]|tara:strand:- start:500 stop:1726 length:1227 start_codon:yes stop_codon:yes gene_type:complete